MNINNLQISNPIFREMILQLEKIIPYIHHFHNHYRHAWQIFQRHHRSEICFAMERWKLDCEILNCASFSALSFF